MSLDIENRENEITGRQYVLLIYTSRRSTVRTKSYESRTIIILPPVGDGTQFSTNFQRNQRQRVFIGWFLSAPGCPSSGGWMGGSRKSNQCSDHPNGPKFGFVRTTVRVGEKKICREPRGAQKAHLTRFSMSNMKLSRNWALYGTRRSMDFTPPSTLTK